MSVQKMYGHQCADENVRTKFVRTNFTAKGVKRTGVDIVAQDVEFLTSKTSAEDDAASKHLQPINDDDTDIPF